MNEIKKEDLTLPIYLNDEIVIDMLAIIEDGFSMVSNVSTTTDSNIQYDSKAAVEGNTDSVLGKLLRISISGNHSSKKNDGASQTRNTERIHTANSLLSKFRKYLKDSNQLYEMNTDVFYKLEPGDFIEAEGILNKSPSISILNDCIEMLNLYKIFIDEPVAVDKNQKQQIKNQKAEANHYIEFMQKLIEKLKVEGTNDFIMKGDISVVLSAQDKYFSKDNISEMIGGTFRVLGKVVQVYKEGSVDLLRKTPFAYFPDEILDQLKEAFNSISLSGLKLPEYKTDVEAPAIVIIPIAIFS